jgi:hypothetical protein
MRRRGRRRKKAKREDGLKRRWERTGEMRLTIR